MTLNAFEGCLLGLALGDALGAPFESGLIERFVWRLIGKTRKGEIRWTDDTQMSIDLAESLLGKGILDADDLAARFARSYRWSRGYGPSTAKMLKRIARGTDWRDANRSVFPNGSFGNGGAMRAPIIGVFYADSPDLLFEAARRSAQVTHLHPQGVEGAVLVAATTALVSRGLCVSEILEETANVCELSQFLDRIKTAAIWLESGAKPPVTEVRQKLGNGIAASESCVTAVYIALRFMDRPFEDMVKFVIDCRGDVDTIGAMAGAIWGAANGADRLPADKLASLEQYARIKSLAVALFEKRQ